MSRAPDFTEVVAIFGPTGIGKTAVAIALADRLRAAGEDPVAVSVDALQLYEGLEVLTGAPTPEQRARLEHRLVGVLPLTARSTAGEFARRAQTEIDTLLQANRRPIVVGGTGLYLRAALAELDFRPPVAPEIRARRAAQLADVGPVPLHEELMERAPDTAATIERTDAQRITRALELLDAGHEPPGAALWTTALRHPTLLAGLTIDRDTLASRIDARVDAMVERGAREEVERADRAGAGPGARQALGFAQLLAGDVEAMKTQTRRYAKRQLTWMRKLPSVTPIDVTGRTPEDVAAEIHGALRA